MRQENDYMDDIDMLIERDYKKYQQERMNRPNKSNHIKNTNNVPTAKKKEPLTENTQLNNVGSEITFAKVKEMGKGQQNLTNLLKLLKCDSYGQAVIKVNQLRKYQKFVKSVTYMMEKCEPNSENDLKTSWRIIKDAIYIMYTQPKSP